MHGILTRFDCKALVTHILQRDDLVLDLLLRELLAADVLVLRVVGAVDAAVDAIVGKIERREHDDTLAVEVLLDLLREGVDLLELFGIVAREKDARLTVVNALAQLRLFDDAVDQLHVVLVFVRIAEGVEDFSVVDEFLSLQ